VDSLKATIPHQVSKPINLGKLITEQLLADDCLGRRSQLTGYIAGAAHVIWVVGIKKIVPTLEVGLKRVEEFTYPMEDERALKSLQVYISIDKMLIVIKGSMPGLTTRLLVKKNLGFR
jgi:hypothetical protein